MAAVVAASLAGLPVPAAAQSLPTGTQASLQMGMSADQLRAVVPGLERVARPESLAGGLRGDWRGAPAEVAGLRLQPVFYFAQGALRRVEYSAVTSDEADRGSRAFAELLDWGRSVFGGEAMARDKDARQTSEIASWVQGGLDIYLQRVDSARQASVRVVYKLRQLKDASEL